MSDMLAEFSFEGYEPLYKDLSSEEVYDRGLQMVSCL